MLTPIGVIGGIRGVVFFANFGGGRRFEGQPFKFCEPRRTPFKFARSSPGSCRRASACSTRRGTNLRSYGPELTISGFRLRDGRASYGIGLETFALGFPIHFDWSWRTLFNRDWEDIQFAFPGGSAQFRKPRFAVWIGYDF
jgi:hypothetical protein